MTVRVVVVAAVFAVAVGSADARVVMMPSIPRSCPSAPSWQKMTACLAKFGKVTIVRSQGTTRLVQVSAAEGRAGFRIPGVCLFTEHEGRWQIGGMLEGADFKVTGFGAVKAGKYTGYRFDVSASLAFPLAIAERTREVKLRRSFSVYCTGVNSVCSEVVTACDVYVAGKSYWTFRGTVELGERSAKVSGDRSKAGELCAQDEEVFLPMVPEPSIL